MEHLLSLDEVADYLHVHQSTIYRLLSRKELPALKVGRDWRFRRDSIDAWIKAQEEKRNASNIRKEDGLI